jgi:ribosomal protein S18 acetylase RimI-like enzyme
MQLMTLGENQKAQRFYERMGMEKLKIVYILENQ